MGTRNTPIANDATKAVASLEAAARLNNAELVKTTEKQKTVYDTYKTETLVAVTGAPMYRAWFGNRMTIVLNGFPVYVPLDGRRYNIPESYAREFNARLRSVNEEMEFRERASNVQNNFEHYAGELNLVSRA